MKMGVKSPEEKITPSYEMSELTAKQQFLDELKELKKDFRRLKKISNSKDIDLQLENKNENITEYRRKLRKMHSEKDKEMIQLYKVKIDELKKFREDIKKNIPEDSDKILKKKSKKALDQAKNNIKVTQLLTSLASLQKFNSASKEVQEVLEGIIAGTIDATSFSQYYSLPKYKKSIDAIYNESANKRGFDSLHTVIRARYEQSGIQFDNAGNLQYENPTRINSSTSELDYSDQQAVLGSNMSRYSSMSWKDTLKKGGLAGGVRKVFDIFPNMKEKTKSTWTSLVMAGAVGWSIWKVGKYLFTGKFFGMKDKDGKERKHSWFQRALVSAGLIFGFNAFGTNPLSATNKLFFGGIEPEKIKTRWPWSFGDNLDDDISLKPGDVASIFATMKVSGMRKMLDEDLKFRDVDGVSSYDVLLHKLEEVGDTKGVELLKKIGKKDRKGVIKGYLTTIGITSYDDMSKMSKNKTIAELMSDKQTLSSYLGDNLELTAEGKNDLSEYQRTHPITTDYLDSLKNDAKIVAVGDAEWLDYSDDTGYIKSSISALSVSDNEKIQLQKTMNTIYTMVDDTEKNNLQLHINDQGLLSGFSSYDYTLPIDYQNMKIVGLSMKFENVDELLKTANLINRIKAIASTKTPGENVEGTIDDRKSPFFLDTGNRLQFNSITDPWYNDLTLLKNYRPFYHSTKHTAKSLGTTEGMKAMTEYLNDWWNTEHIKKYS